MPKTTKPQNLKPSKQKKITIRKELQAGDTSKGWVSKRSHLHFGQKFFFVRVMGR